MKNSNFFLCSYNASLSSHLEPERKQWLKKEKAKRSRTKFECPIEGCDFWGEQLPRHMKILHGWRPSKAQKIANCFELRKKYTYAGKSKKGGSLDANRSTKKKAAANKNYHKKWLCLVRNCYAVILRPAVHLHSEHGLEINSEAYLEFLSQCKPFVAGKNPPERNKIWKHTIIPQTKPMCG